MRRPEVPLLALVLGAYAYFYQAGGWNQNSRLDLTRALVDDGKVTIDRMHANTGDLSRRGDHFYCDKAPGMSLLAVPPYAAARALGARDPDAAAYFATVASTGVPAALGVLALYLVAIGLGSTRRRAALLAVGLGLGTLFFPYATLFYGHDVMGALFLLAFAILARARLAGQVPSAAALVGVGALLGWAVVVEYPAAIGVAILLVYAATFVPPRRLLLIVAGGLAPAAVLALYHTVAFGGPLVLPYQFSTQKHRHLGWFMGIGVPRRDAIVGVTFSSYRGLFNVNPWLLLAVPGAWLLARARATRREAIVCAAIVVLFFWLNVSLVDWDGGWACGPRYLVPAIPFLAVAAAGWPRGRIAGYVLGFLIFVSAAHMLFATTVKPEVPSAVKEPYHAYLVPRFMHGELSISPQSIDRIDYPDGARPVAWNLGQKLGLGGLASLLPLLLYVAGCGAWLVIATRDPARAGAAATSSRAAAAPSP